MAVISGWGRGTWSQAAWGEPLPVIVTGVAGTSAVGTVAVVAEANVPATGLAATGGVGSVTVTGVANVVTTGETGTGAVGTVVVAANADVGVTGSAGTGGVGTVTMTGDANVPQTGIVGTGAVGTVVVAANADVGVTGESATGATGSVDVIAKAVVAPTGIEVTGGVGSVTISAAANVLTTGVDADLQGVRGLDFVGVGDAQISTTKSKVGSSSVYLDGTGDYLTSGRYNFGTSNFTVEAWFNPDSVSGSQNIIDLTVDDSQKTNMIARMTGSSLVVLIGGSNTVVNKFGVFSVGTWTHIALMRSGSTVYAYVDGVRVGQFSTSSNFGVTKVELGGSVLNYEGYIDHVRFSSTNRYGFGANFTPSTTAYVGDSDTKTILEFEGSDGSTDIVNSFVPQVVTVAANADVAPTGLAATGGVGSVEIDGEANVPATGIEATSGVGSVTIDAAAGVAVTGEEATGAVGTVAVDAAANVSIVVDDAQSIQYGTGQVGTVVAGISVDVVTTGLASSINVGNVTVKANADAIVTGFELQGDTGEVKVFDQIIPVQNPSYSTPSGATPGAPLSSPNYKDPEGVPRGFVRGDRLQSAGWKNVA